MRIRCLREPAAAIERPQTLRECALVCRVPTGGVRCARFDEEEDASDDVEADRTQPRNANGSIGFTSCVLCTVTLFAGRATGRGVVHV